MLKANQKQAGKVPGRNDPCPCGSGKKYKKCCMGKLESAGEQAQGSSLEQLSTEAATLFENGQLGIAANVANKILAISPNNADANHILGAIEMARGNMDGAEPILLKAAKYERKNGHILLNLAKLYELKKDFDTALSFIEQSEKLEPDLADVQNTYGNILLKIGDVEKAVPRYEKAIKIEPSNPDYLIGYFAGLYKSSRVDEARSGYHELIKRYPAYISSYINLAAIYRDLGDIEQAIGLLRQAIELQPGNAELYADLGTLYGRAGEYEKEVDFYKKALELDPEALDVYSNLMDAFFEQQRFDELYENAGKIVTVPELEPLLGKAIIAFEAVAALDELRDAFEAWVQKTGNDGNDDESRLLFLAANCLDYLDAETVYSLHRNWGKKLESNITPFTHDKKRCGNQKIRIGYVSPDFRKHPVGFFIRDILEYCDAGSFEVYCYSNTETEDEVTEQIKKSVTQYKQISLFSHKKVAAQIHNDQVDILVDLAGHTQKTRVPAFAYKPAPVQITYLGYPNTTGLETIDYRITDHYADTDSGTRYTEKLVYMPESFISFGSFPEVSIENRLAYETNGHVTFGSFNSIRKLNRTTIEIWSAILLRDPNYKLILKSGGLDQKIVRNNIYTLFADYGVGRDRLEVIGHIDEDTDHLAAYNRIDIALDTFPYNGTTTTCEALWMGVPVITLLGEKHAQRVSYSILKNIGVENTIAHTREEYIELAVNLASSPDELRKLKLSLRKRLQNSILCDSPRFTRQLEDVYRELWQNYCEGVI